MPNPMLALAALQKNRADGQQLPGDGAPPPPDGPVVAPPDPVEQVMARLDALDSKLDQVLSALNGDAAENSTQENTNGNGD